MRDLEEENDKWKEKVQKLEKYRSDELIRLRS